MDRRATSVFFDLALFTLAGAGIIYACFGGENKEHANFRVAREERQYTKPKEVFHLATEMTKESFVNLTDTNYVPCNPASVPLEVKLNAFMRMPISDMTDGNRYKEKQILEDKQYLLEHPLEAERYWDDRQKEIASRYGLK